MLWHTGIEVIKALFAPALNKQHMKDTTKGFTNIMASHHNLRVAREPYCISRPIRHTVIFSLEILEKNYDECILILVIYWKKTGLLHTKISNHNIIYWKKTGLLHTKISNHNIMCNS